jgi:hypothetical protein
MEFEVFELDNIGTDLVEKPTVMTDHDKSVSVLDKIGLEPQNSFQIEVIRWLLSALHSQTKVEI